jgi:hypothetical protein
MVAGAGLPRNQMVAAPGPSPTPFQARRLECYIVTMAPRLTLHPLSPSAGTGARLVVAGVVLGLVWLAVLWALT